MNADRVHDPAHRVVVQLLGVVGGLFLGKQIGILSAVYLAKRARIAALPAGASWRQIYGVAVLCGIGFTMSLFIGELAFEKGARVALHDQRPPRERGITWSSVNSPAGNILPQNWQVL